MIINFDYIIILSLIRILKDYLVWLIGDHQLLFQYLQACYMVVVGRLLLLL